MEEASENYVWHLHYTHIYTQTIQHSQANIQLDVGSLPKLAEYQFFICIG